MWAGRIAPLPEMIREGFRVKLFVCRADLKKFAKLHRNSGRQKPLEGRGSILGVFRIPFGAGKEMGALTR